MKFPLVPFSSPVNKKLSTYLGLTMCKHWGHIHEYKKQSLTSSGLWSRYWTSDYKCDKGCEKSTGSYEGIRGAKQRESGRDSLRK